MTKRMLLLVILGCALLLPAAASAIDGLPGKTYGELRWEIPHKGDGVNDLILEGWIEQGVYWYSWRNVKFNTFAQFRYKLDSESLDYNNSVGPALGLAFEFFTPKGIYGRAGAEYIWERFFETDRTEQKAVLFVNWYAWWDLQKGRKR